MKSGVRPTRNFPCHATGERGIVQIRIHNMQLQHAVVHFSSPRKHVGDGWQVPIAARIRMANELIRHTTYHRRASLEAWGPARFARSRGGMSQVRLSCVARTKARPSRVAPTSYPPCLFPTLTSTHPRGIPNFNPAQYSDNKKRKGPKRTRHETRNTRAGIPLSVPSSYESSQVRPPLRFHGLVFLFDFAAGSLALKFFWENIR
jgi:hypothetical protein